MRIKLIPLLFAAVVLAGSWTSCKHSTSPNTDTTHKKCDTCINDTSHHPCDTCNKPCDTCNINQDSAAHAFIWKEFTIPSEANLNGVWIFGPNDMIIVGDRLWHFDGAIFSPIEAVNNTHHSSMDGGLSGFNIFAFSKTDYWLVSGSIAFHTSDGKYFDDNRKGAVNACWGTSSNDMYFVGNAGHIFHYDGTNFADMTSNTTKDIRKVWGTSHNDVWAGGLNRSTGVSVLLHYDGNAWAEINLSDLGQFGCANCDGVSAVWTIDSTVNHHVVYVGGSFFYRRTDNGIWTNDGDNVGNKLSGGGYAGLIGIRGNNSSDIMCVSGWGFAAHWNGKTWKRYDEIYNPGNSNFITNAMHYTGNTACMVGFKVGQSWMAVGTRK